MPGCLKILYMSLSSLVLWDVNAAAMDGRPVDKSPPPVKNIELIRKVLRFIIYYLICMPDDL